MFRHDSYKWKIDLELGDWGQKVTGGTISWGMKNNWEDSHYGKTDVFKTSIF